MEHERKNSTVTVRISGELDHCSAQTIRRELDDILLDPGVRQLVLDFGGVTFMDSSGIGVILGRYRALSLRGGKVAVKNMNPQVKKVFLLSGMDQARGMRFCIQKGGWLLSAPSLPVYIIFSAGKDRTIIMNPGLSSCSKKRVWKAGSTCSPAGGTHSVSEILSVIADTGIPFLPNIYIPFRSSTVMDHPPVSVRAENS